MSTNSQQNQMLCSLFKKFGHKTMMGSIIKSQMGYSICNKPPLIHIYKKQKSVYQHFKTSIPDIKQRFERSTGQIVKYLRIQIRDLDLPQKQQEIRNILTYPGINFNADVIIQKLMKKPENKVQVVIKIISQDGSQYKKRRQSKLRNHSNSQNILINRRIPQQMADNQKWDKLV